MSRAEHHLPYQTIGSKIKTMMKGVGEMRLFRQLLICFCALFLAFLFTAFPCKSEEASGFDVVREGNILSYCENSFLVTAPEPGQLTITVHDNVTVYRTIIQQVVAGENRIRWDGCGYNREKLYPKSYMITCTLESASGRNYSISFQSPIEYTGQALQYALPSAENIYLDSADTWFVEYKTVMNGKVILLFSPDESGRQEYTYSVTTTGGKIARTDLKSLARDNLPQAGCYHVTVYEETKKTETISFPVQVLTDSPGSPEIRPTGEIMPDRSMSSGEIWDIMMRPSVVLDIDFFDHQAVFAEPDKGSASLGTLHGQTQCLKVIRIEGEWALVGAWNHEEADYVEGWVPSEKLKMVSPQTEYGILIDKQDQTLTVFREGKIIDRLFVSTGRAEEKKLYQETSAGCFLTGYHRVNFSMNGRKYDYVIQYDGGNLLHQTPYEWGSQKKDFTYGRGYLGAKASHACVRIQPDPGEGGTNAYWLWTHIPYHTRVIVLDDPEERKATVSKLKRNGQKKETDEGLNLCTGFEPSSEELVTITFGGTATPGGKRSFNARNDSFAAFVRREGTDKPMGNLQAVFDSDDLTCISLGCPLEEKEDDFADISGIIYGPAEMSGLFRSSSVEMVQITDEKVLSYGQRVTDKTVNSLFGTASILPANCSTVRIRGHLFGFAACNEKEYLKNPGIIAEMITQLKEMHCEKIIMLFSWGKENDSRHSIVQEAMAGRSVTAGADLVIGSHPGCVQGIDYIRGVPVIYGLGDLLEGSTLHKPKNQQGILVRAGFAFGQDAGSPSIEVIPILPYGNDTDSNGFCPDLQLPREKALSVINAIRWDSTDEAITKTAFYLADAE